MNCTVIAGHTDGGDWDIIHVLWPALKLLKFKVHWTRGNYEEFMWRTAVNLLFKSHETIFCVKQAI